jgi:hypothetical protein
MGCRFGAALFDESKEAAETQWLKGALPARANGQYW